MTTNAASRGPARFRLGRLLATPAALETLASAGLTPAHLLARHRAGDWGDLGAADARANDAALAGGGRLFSAYETAAGRVWVISEWDRSATTVLLPADNWRAARRARRRAPGAPARGDSAGAVPVHAVPSWMAAGRE